MEPHETTGNSQGLYEVDWMTSDGNKRWAVTLDCGHLRQVTADFDWHPLTSTLHQGQKIYCPDHERGQKLRKIVAYWEPDGFRIMHP